jgi:hypothetical protein
MATPTTLPAAFVSGNVLEASQLNNLRGAFRIMQVVSSAYATQAISSSATFADTGLTATITPSATTSKILVMVTQNGVIKNAGDAGNCVDLRLVRGATTLVNTSQIGKTNTDLLNIIGTASIIYLDSPATTSATTYKTQFANNAGTASGAFVQFNGDTSNITLFEVSA